MPATSSKQANAAKLAGAVKAGKFPKSKAGASVKSMSKMPMQKLKHFMKMRESLDENGKRKLLHALRLYKEIQEPMNLEEDEETSGEERNVIAKTFDTKADFDSYANQRRGIEMTPMEQQSILNYKEAKPTQQDRFFVKYETTDDFGNNTTTIIKKLKEGNQFCWTAFSKHETAEEEGQPEGSKEESPLKEADQPPMANNNQQQQPEEDEVTVDDPIRITKTITFIDETEGAKILSDFLRKLEI